MRVKATITPRYSVTDSGTADFPVNHIETVFGVTPTRSASTRFDQPNSRSDSSKLDTF